MPPSKQVTLVVDDGSVPALVDFLARVGCDAHAAAPGRVVAWLPRAESEVEARREFEIYVRVWNAMHPRSPVGLA